MECEIVAIGSELLLGQIVDTNSAWISEQLALAGVTCRYHSAVGDNLGRIVETLRRGVERSGAVIVCGGLGPTHDDLTRSAIAQLLGVELVLDDDMAARISEMFESRGRSMPMNNLLQAERPEGARFLERQPGTAPGLVAEVDRNGGRSGVIYAVPGVPWEMKEMVTADVLPDLRRRLGADTVIRSRTVLVWGLSESGVGERLAGLIADLDRSGDVTLALLASGIEGLKVRLTATAAEEAAAFAALERRVDEVIAAVGAERVFGFDDQTMESVVLDALGARGLTLGAAESLTGGLVGSRLVAIPGASRVFRGSIVAYSPELKRSILGVGDGPVVTTETVEQMVRGAQTVLGCDAAVATSGVAGPDGYEGLPPGTVCLAAGIGDEIVSTQVRMPGRRQQVREFSVISVLDLLRQMLSPTG